MRAFLLGFALLVGSAACDRGELKREWDQRDAHVKKLDQALRDAAQKVKKEAGKPECKRSSECRLVGLGAKVCDYYKDFLVYSTSQADESKLLPLVAEFNRLAEEQYNLSLSVSTCGKPMARVACIDGGCMPVGDANAVFVPRDGANAGRPTKKK